LLICASTD